MNPETTYAIVDLEATGTGLNSGECIIQFACILYRNGKIIEEFNTLVQPEKKISKYITELTGISNQDVKTAPYFDEIAEIILNLLDGTVFVAHNVGFDFRFLNEHLEKNGFPVLTNKTIDTVELSQVLWPSADSYKLDELADLINAPLLDAHNALADARVTVKLFQALWDHANSLPQVTIKELARLSDCLAFDTGIFFADALEYGRGSDDDYTIISEIAFKSYEYPLTSDYQLGDYPKTIAEKESLFLPKFEKRMNQWKMMDLLFKSFEHELENNLAVEAPAGIGKTLGYLFPLTYLIDEQKPLLISTQTTLLQEQIKKTVHSQLTQLQGHDYLVAIAKSPSHYLNIAAFSKWIKEINAKNSSAFTCMRILVWLTETTTGDLEEIGRGSQSELDLWEVVTGYSSGTPSEYWREVDFLSRREWKIQHASILITNHTYLAHDWSKTVPTLPTQTITVFDEAHHLPDVVSWQTLIQLGKKEMLDTLVIFREFMEENSVIERTTPAEINQINYYLNWLSEALTIYFHQWQQGIPHTDESKERWLKCGFDPNHQNIQQKRLYRETLENGHELTNLMADISERSFKEGTRYKVHRQYIQIKLHNTLQSFVKQLNKFQQLFNHRPEKNYSYWMSYDRENIDETLTIKMSKLDEEHLLIERFMNHRQLLLTSSSLSNNDSVKYLENSLGNIKLDLHQIPSEYDYEHYSMVLMPEEKVNPLNENMSSYALKVTQQLEKILKDTELKALVIFHSLELLEAVSEQLRERKNLIDYQILVQGKSGSRTRILRRFKNSERAILLGSNSFSEGLDLPGEELDVEILPRLPFDSPELPIFEIYEQTIPEEKRLFSEIMLPRAIIRFKQIFGRLIRSSADRGILIVLDSRYQTANYKKLFSQAIPAKTPQQIQHLDQINQQLKEFF